MTSDNDLIRRGDALALFKSYDWSGSWLAPIMRGKADAITALPAVTVGVSSNERAHLLHTLSEALDAAEGGEFQTVEIYFSDARRLFKVLDALRVMDGKS